ncbi:MAG TPA: peptidase, partial [Blastocatellia bacterium]|nr:peptidase [Blastocatellia bacterium]
MPAEGKLYQGLDSFITNSRAEFENKLAELVEVPTISMEPERQPDIRRGAALARQYLESIGANASIVETPGNPVVFGRIETNPANPTLT